MKLDLLCSLVRRLSPRPDEGESLGTRLQIFCDTCASACMHARECSEYKGDLGMS